MPQSSRVLPMMMALLAFKRPLREALTRIYHSRVTCQREGYKMTDHNAQFEQRQARLYNKLAKLMASRYNQCRKYAGNDIGEV